MKINELKYSQMLTFSVVKTRQTLSFIVWYTYVEWLKQLKVWYKPYLKHKSKFQILHFAYW